MALQHGRPTQIELLFQRSDDGGVIMAGVVHAIAGEKIENALSIVGEKFGSYATYVAYVHLQQPEQSDPLRIYMILIERFQRRRADSFHHAVSLKDVWQQRWEYRE